MKFDWFVVCWNVLEVFPTNSVDSDQTALGTHCLSLYLALLNNVSKKMQQTTIAAGIFGFFFLLVLKRTYAVLPNLL